MAVSVKTSGSQTAVIGTEHTLATVTDPGTYVLAVNAVNMVDDDELELRILCKLDTGDDSECVYNQAYMHKQGDGLTAKAKGTVLKFSVPVPAPIEFVAKLHQKSGTGRVFDWVIYEL